MKTLQSFRENDMIFSTQTIKLKNGRMFTLSTRINTWILQIFSYSRDAVQYFAVMVIKIVLVDHK